MTHLRTGGCVEDIFRRFFVTIKCRAGKEGISFKFILYSTNALKSLSTLHSNIILGSLTENLKNQIYFEILNHYYSCI